MSQYTTGEIAKLCGVSVRTVQYYDTRGILVPSALSEGGRRLYSEHDLKRMKIICFLRELALPINSISQLLAEERPERVLALLLKEQEKALREELDETQAQLTKLEELKQTLKLVEPSSVESIGDAAHIMQNKKKLRKTRAVMLSVGLVMELIEIGTLILGIMTGIWWPFAVGMCGVAALGVWISVYYFKRTAYICPQCHAVFKPAIQEALWARHTPNTRKLTCPECGHKGFCVETYGKDEQHA